MRRVDPFGHGHRLDQKRKGLVREKEALLKESKAKLATMESVKTHIDTLMKVSPSSADLVVAVNSSLLFGAAGRDGYAEEGQRPRTARTDAVCIGTGTGALHARTQLSDWLPDSAAIRPLMPPYRRCTSVDGPDQSAPPLGLPDSDILMSTVI